MNRAHLHLQSVGVGAAAAAVVWTVMALVRALGQWPGPSGLYQLLGAGAAGPFLALAPLATATLLAILALVVAVALRWRASEAAGATELAMLLGALALYVAFTSADGAFASRPWPGFGSGSGLYTVINPFSILALAALVAFTLTFPAGHRGSSSADASPRDGWLASLRPFQRIRRLAQQPRRFLTATAALALLFTVAALVTPWPGTTRHFVGAWFLVPVPLDSWVHVGPFGIHAGRAFATFITGAFMTVLILGVGTGVHNLRVTLRTAPPDHRRRIFWIFQGLVSAAVILGVLAALSALTFPPPWLLATRPGLLMINVALLAIVFFLAVAVFYSGAISPALAIRRTALSGAGAAALIFVIAGTEALLSDWLFTRFGTGRGLTTFLSAGAFGCAVGLLRRPIGAMASRLPPRNLAAGPDVRASGGA